MTYGSRGRPTKPAIDLEELVLILQGAIESVDAERFVLERDAAEIPQELRTFARSSSYEVSVVGRFHTLAQRWVERQRLSAFWERPVAHRATGSGRQRTIDISLFGEPSVPPDPGQPPARRREVRLEFGFFTIASPTRLRTKRVDHAKIQQDAEKLHQLKDTAAPVPGNFTVENYMLLWRVANERNTGNNIDWHQRALTTAAAAAVTASPQAGLTIDHLLTSSVDLIAAKKNEHRVAYVGAFQVS
ncbi:hypothetical protein [Clavibacter michiganensis]|uniref:hypothetical protein n=1 Tax=Clavibacter michiganensis TaxID=28447 RepID=UPI001BE0A794|nr:hypothetical protein [Clavibacter michiganensis]MBT1634610.1 hypothetical protein [Clavibacter michiganensis]